ncbi:COG3740 Phage head maturation protease [uncultured Caudovirales phage]|uniref:COG3740 Phage head maturation protease n=1 Tax=uncultured Caudovirales phage TaxID=2100421 RepID=A0A6J5PFQ3_9CAUD|nr:COG3740 Phage head maturation protease [uncultured Caudovirales phage]
MDNKGHIYTEIKAMGEDGTFTGIASMYGVTDLEGDVIEKGAFTKTIRENPEVPVLWQHDDEEVIGLGTVTEKGNKIEVTGKLDMEDPVALNAYRKIKNGLVKGLSIGFMAVKKTYGEEDGKYVRRLQEIKLMEVSIVTFPAMTQAQITSVKAADETTQRIKALEDKISALEAEKAAPAAPAKPEPVADHSAELALARLRMLLN